MNKLLTMVGLIAVLTLGCDSAPSVSVGGSDTSVASIAPENKATAVYTVTGMT